MKFSIITVCYNSEKTIRRTFDSVLNQSCTDYEYVVVDGASSDETVEIIKEYETKFNGRMRWVSEPDKGIYDAMNKGIRMAQGEFVNMMNSDDQLAPDALKHAAEELEKTPDTDILNGVQIKINEQGVPLYVLRHSPVLLPDGVETRHQSAFIRRTLHETIGFYDGETYPLSADYDFFLKAYLAKAKFTDTDYILSIFSMSGASAVNSLKSAREVCQIKMANKLMSRYGYWLFCRSVLLARVDLAADKILRMIKKLLRRER